MPRNCNNITLTGLGQPNACQNNRSGVKVIYVCPMEDVVRINAQRHQSPTTPGEFVTIGQAELGSMAIECKPNKGFVKIFCANDMGELKYTAQGEIIGCRSQLASLDIFHPGFSREALGFLHYANNCPMVIVARLNNDTYHLLGDEDEGAQIASGNEATSGKARGDNNGINPVWEVATPAAAIFWEGFDPTSATEGIPIIGEVEIDPEEEEGDDTHS